MGILGVGTPFLDYVVQVSDQDLETVGAKGSFERIDDYTTFKTLLRQLENTLPSPGGSCANTIKALQALGHKCRFIGTIGTDEEGHHLKGEFQKRGIEEHLQTFEGKTGQLICYVTRDGERTFRNFFGVSDKMAELKIDDSHFQGISLLHMDGYTILYEGLCERVMSIAKKNGIVVSFDLGSFSILETGKEQVKQLLQNFVKIVFANAKEAETLTGKQDITKACEELGKLCEIAIVTHGKDGCWVSSEKKVEHFPAIPTQVTDTTGAGDLFTAGFMHETLQKKPIKEAAHSGARLASEVIKIFGADLPVETIKKLGL